MSYSEILFLNLYLVRIQKKPPKNTKKVNPAETLILLHGIDQTLSSILSSNGA